MQPNATDPLTTCVGPSAPLEPKAAVATPDALPLVQDDLMGTPAEDAPGPSSQSRVSEPVQAASTDASQSERFKTTVIRVKNTLANIKQPITKRWRRVRENNAIRTPVMKIGWIAGVVSATSLAHLLAGSWVGMLMLAVTATLAILTYPNYARSFRYRGVTVTQDFIDTAMRLGYEERNRRPFKRYELRYGDKQTKALWKMAERIERKIFRESDGNTRWQLFRANFPYRRTTLLYLTVDQTGPIPLPENMIRFVWGSSMGLPSVKGMKDWGQDVHAAFEKADLDYDSQYYPNTGDIVMLASLNRGRRYEYNGVKVQVTLGLYAFVSRRSLELGIEEWRTIMNRHALRGLQSLDEPFELFEEFKEHPYFGSRNSRPIHGKPRRWHERMQRNNPTLDEQIFGHALDPIFA